MSSAGNDRPTRHVLDPERVQAVFTAARARDPAERRAFLDEHCEGDDKLRREVEELLAHDAAAGAFLADPVWRKLARALLADLEPGDLIGEYRLEGLLGCGGTSSVFIAVEQRSGRRVALKVVSLSTLGARVRDRFIREVEVATAVGHPHLVEVLGSGEDEARGLLYCAMRLVDGPNLAEVLQGFASRQRVPSSAERRVLVERFAEVAAGLAELHSQGLVHRDVKPANIVLHAGLEDEPLRSPAVLVDFGLVADSAANRSAVSTLWASFDYAAPEQILGRSVSPAGDVFALGVTMHDLLAGRLPAARERTPAEGLESLTSLVPGIERELAAIVAMASDPEPRWRYRDGGALLADLHAFLNGGRVHASHVSLAVRAGRFALRHPARAAAVATRWVLGLLAGVLLTLVAQQIWTAWQVREASAAALRHGDLAEIERLAGEAGLLERWFLPVMIRRLVTSEGGGTDDALAEVFAVGRRMGWQTALTLAACHLERDGVPRHPELARFLCFAVEPGSPIDGLPIVARLFHERPNRDHRDLEATARFRGALSARLDVAQPLDALDVVVALAGCGDMESLKLCAHAATGWTQREPHASIGECWRVAMENLAILVRRVVHLNPQARTQVVQLERELSDAAHRVSEGATSSRVLDDRLERAIGQLALQFARLRRGEPDIAQSVRWEGLLGRCAAIWVRAARADPEIRGAVLRGGFEVHEPRSERSHAYRGRLLASDLGYLAGLLADAACTEQLRKDVRAAGPSWAELEPLFDERLRDGQRTLAGVEELESPDADSHLGRALDLSRRRTEIVGIDHEPAPRTVAEWDFCVPPVAVAGAAKTITLSETDLRTDEYESRSGFARLALPAISEVELPFDADATPTAIMVLRIEAQKAVRAALPMDGVAALDVLVDGVTIFRHAMLPGSSAERFELPLCDASVPRHRVLTLRLSSQSTTTLRLYRVHVGW